MSDNTILVTGAAGFIGSHVVDALLASGRRVAAVDDLSTGHRENLPPDAEFHELSILDPRLRDVVADVRPVAVIHLAAQISVAVSTRDPVKDATINVMGSLNLLEALRPLGFPRIVFASTGGAIYGEPDCLPVDETHPCRPISPYAASKLAVEHYLHTYRVQYGCDYSILRLGNIYGPRQDPHGEAGVVAIFARAMLADGRVTVFGDGTDERDYVYVSDAVQAILLAMETGGPEPYNVGTGEGTSVNALVEHMAPLTGYRRAPLHGPPRPGDIRKVRLDAGRAAAALGWRPRVAMPEGLAETVDFFRNEARGAQ